MTLQEKELLAQFLQQLGSAEAGQKDTEAEALITQAVARQPDAAYLLVQRALQLEQLLQASQEQIRKLQAEADPARTNSSGRFLGDPNAWGSRTGAVAGQQRLAPQTVPGRAGSWSSGLFGNIASTAAGVVAGSFLFQGIQGLMNRGESDQLAGSPSPTEDTLHELQHEEPELLNSYNTPAAADDGTLMAELDDPSDFV